LRFWSTSKPAHIVFCTGITLLCLGTTYICARLIFDFDNYDDTDVDVLLVGYGLIGIGIISMTLSSLYVYGKRRQETPATDPVYA